MTDLLENRSLGASALLTEFAARATLLNKEELFDLLGKLKAVFPLMAVWLFAEEYFKAHNPGDASIKTFIARIREAGDQVIHLALDRLQDYQVFLTLSRSSLVEQFLLARERSDNTRVICSRSLPAQEGRHLYEKLRQAGLPTKCVDDWLIGDELKTADVVVLGADWVTEEMIINKWGSFKLVEQARRSGKPVFVLAESFKKIEGVRFAQSLFYQDWSQGSTKRKIQVFETIPVSAGLEVL